MAADKTYAIIAVRKKNLVAIGWRTVFRMRLESSQYEPRKSSVRLLPPESVPKLQIQ